MNIEATAPGRTAGTEARLFVLAARLEAEFLKARELVVSIPDKLYTERSGRPSGVGAHFRHNLDFAFCLISGVRNGSIDYSARERDERVENDTQYAAARIDAVLSELRSLVDLEPETNLELRSEIDDLLVHETTLSRELEFLLSHTVHHHALLAERLRQMGFDPGEEFGVAPSTLRFWNEKTGTQEE